MGTAAARGAQPHSAWDSELAPDLPSVGLLIEAPSPER